MKSTKPRSSSKESLIANETVYPEVMDIFHMTDDPDEVIEILARSQANLKIDSNN